MESLEGKLDRSLDALISESGPQRRAVTSKQQNRSSPYGIQQERSRLPLEDQVVVDMLVTDRADGGITVRYKQTDIVLLDGATGVISLHTGGYMGLQTRTAMNVCLKPINITVDELNPDGGTTWQVVDGRTKMLEFEDGMEIRTVGISKPLLLARGSVIKQYMQQKKKDVESKRRQATNLKQSPTITLNGTQYVLVQASQAPRPPPPPPKRESRRR
ncbi:MAG: hypothetical protein KVP17_003435 [Porospora cf. gigantea B]|uniref:uncharacterized protein n=1 Tax=Porospora cf. gigantea B TaxID=2853592 RepID=UPI003571DD48|nr:MAG: hypothetical protein KVP17_003435 [Porospora cf. gigantea B]